MVLGFRFMMTRKLDEDPHSALCRGPLGVLKSCVFCKGSRRDLKCL